MKKLVIGALLISSVCMAEHEATSFGTITGIESRPWGLHVQTSFSGGSKNGCLVNVGDTYMYDFEHTASYNGDSSDDETSMLLAAFAAQSQIAFHIYECNSSNSRPLIGYIRLKK